MWGAHACNVLVIGFCDHELGNEPNRRSSAFISDGERFGPAENKFVSGESRDQHGETVRSPNKRAHWPINRKRSRRLTR